jgi:hypothetical protein
MPNATKKTSSVVVAWTQKQKPPLPKGSDLFGGEFPANSTGVRQVKTKWMAVKRRIENSYFSALARFGPMTRSRKAFISSNGYRVCK